MQPLRILLVEDDPFFQKIITRFSQNNGFQLFVATNGKEALEFLDHNPYDLILLDVEMPDMDGYEALEFIRNNARNHNIPIIMISGDEKPKQALDSMLKGANTFMKKPFTEKQLLAEIDTLFLKF
jgi:CheY-like chemotaxis protein